MAPSIFSTSPVAVFSSPRWDCKQCGLFNSPYYSFLCFARFNSAPFTYLYKKPCKLFLTFDARAVSRKCRPLPGLNTFSPFFPVRFLLFFPSAPQSTQSSRNSSQETVSTCPSDFSLVLWILLPRSKVTLTYRSFFLLSISPPCPASCPSNVLGLCHCWPHSCSPFSPPLLPSTL